MPPHSWLVVARIRSQPRKYTANKPTAGTPETDGKNTVAAGVAPVVTDRRIQTPPMPYETPATITKANPAETFRGSQAVADPDFGTSKVALFAPDAVTPLCSSSISVVANNGAQLMIAT